MNIIKSFTLILGALVLSFLLTSCEKDKYYYLSQNQKQSLKYFQGDTLLFIFKKDSTIGVIPEYKFDFSDEWNEVFSYTHIHNEGATALAKDIKNNNNLMGVSVYTYSNEVRFSFSFNLDNINGLKNPSISRLNFLCLVNEGAFQTIPDDPESSTIKVLESGDYEFTTKNLIQPFKLFATKNKICKYLILPNADTMFIELKPNPNIRRD